MTKIIPTWLMVLLLLVAFMGFIDASFLTGEHYLHMVPPCFITSGCDAVTTSSYSKILGIPVALLGMGYYLCNLGLAIYYADKKKRATLQLIHWITFVGMVVSAWFLYVQAFIIHSWCIYCLTSAGTSTILFILGSLAFHVKWNHQTLIDTTQ